MSRAVLMPLAVISVLVGGCTTTGSYSNRGNGYYDRAYYSQYGAYDYDRPDPSYNGYHADRYYRDDRRYREHQLSGSDRVYRGRDGRYYCRRSDGSTGLIVGAVAGGVLGNVIAPGDSETLGTVLGAVAGAVAGRAIDRDNVRCR